MKVGNKHTWQNAFNMILYHLSWPPPLDTTSFDLPFPSSCKTIVGFSKVPLSLAILSAPKTQSLATRPRSMVMPLPSCQQRDFVSFSVRVIIIHLWMCARCCATRVSLLIINFKQWPPGCVTRVPTYQNSVIFPTSLCCLCIIMF